MSEQAAVVQNNDTSNVVPVSPPDTSNGVSEGVVGEIEAAIKAYAESGGETSEESEPVANPTESDIKTDAEQAQQTKTEEKPKVGTEEELSNGWAALRSRKDRFEKDREEFKAERESFTKEREALQKERAEFNSYREKAKTNPLEALQAIGWTLEQAIKYVNDNGTIPPDVLNQNIKSEFSKEIEELKNKLNSYEEREKKANEEKSNAERLAQQRQYAEQYEKRTAQEIETILNNEGAKYKFFSMMPKDVQLMATLDTMITAHQAKKPIALSDAMLHIEAEAKKQAGWYGVVDAARPDPSQGRDVKSSNPGQSVQPISNAEVARGGTVVKKTPDDMNDEERMEEAMKLYR